MPPTTRKIDAFTEAGFKYAEDAGPFLIPIIRQASLEFTPSELEAMALDIEAHTHHVRTLGGLVLAAEFERRKKAGSKAMGIWKEHYTMSELEKKVKETTDLFKVIQTYNTKEYDVERNLKRKRESELIECAEELLSSAKKLREEGLKEEK